MYSNPWLFQGQPFDGPIKGYEGFVYLIENKTTNQKYLGKKHFWSRTKNRKTKRRETKESDWRSYYGSNDVLKQDVVLSGEDNFVRTILNLCVYKKEMSFWEEKLQWDNNVLLSDDWYNTNIAGRYFVRERHIYQVPFKEVTEKNDKWRELASERMKGEGNPAKSPEARRKISDKKKGQNHHQFGKKITEEHKAKLHEASQLASRQKVEWNGVVYNSGIELRVSNGISTTTYYKLLKKGEIKKV